ncbi:hypothetical protein CYMTET_20840, partial [Cymbomonas tetramitiformis]
MDMHITGCLFECQGQQGPLIRTHLGTLLTGGPPPKGLSPVLLCEALSEVEATSCLREALRALLRAVELLADP